MRRMWILLLTMMVTLALAAQETAKKPETGEKKHQAAAKAGGGVESKIMDLENKWTEAGKKSDPSIVDPILAPEFITLNSDGTYKNKKEYMAGFSNSKWETNEVSDMKVKMHGNMAVVTGTWKGKGTAEGKPVDTTEHFIDTFMKMPDGSWKAISSGSVTMK